MRKTIKSLEEALENVRMLRSEDLAALYKNKQEIETLKKDCSRLETDNRWMRQLVQEMSTTIRNFAEARR